MEAEQYTNTTDNFLKETLKLNEEDVVKFRELGEDLDLDMNTLLKLYIF